MKLKEFVKNILGINLTKFQVKILETKGDLKFYPIRRHGRMKIDHSNKTIR